MIAARATVKPRTFEEPAPVPVSLPAPSRCGFCGTIVKRGRRACSAHTDVDRILTALDTGPSFRYPDRP